MLRRKRARSAEVTGQAGHYFQVAWVVDDLEAAMQRWLKTTRVGPFFVNAHIDPGPVLYRGRPTGVDYSVALAQAGAIQIELIEQHNDEPSVYQEHGPGGAGGVHHMACFAPDFDAEVAHLRGQGF